MATQKSKPQLIPGHVAHTRTQESYMGALLDAVSLDDWREVVSGAVQAAKGGDPQARNWLAQYLVGRPESKAPTPLTVVVNQLNGTDKLLDTLANDAYMAAAYPKDNAAYKANLREQLAFELASKVQTHDNPASMRVNG
jgi:hypothetical protein